MQLAPLKNKLTDTASTSKYFVRPNLALGVAYWYEDYKVEDFALNSTVLNQLNPLNCQPYRGSGGPRPPRSTADTSIATTRHTPGGCD